MRPWPHAPHSMVPPHPLEMEPQEGGGHVVSGVHATTSIGTPARLRPMAPTESAPAAASCGTARCPGIPRSALARARTGCIPSARARVIASSRRAVARYHHTRCRKRNSRRRFRERWMRPDCAAVVSRASWARLSHAHRHWTIRKIPYCTARTPPNMTWNRQTATVSI
jgi:hypothetical protein